MLGPLWLTCLEAAKMTCCATGLAEALSVAFAVLEDQDTLFTPLHITHRSLMMLCATFCKIFVADFEIHSSLRILMTY